MSVVSDTTAITTLLHAKAGETRLLQEMLETKGGLYLSEAVIAEALRLANEI